MKIADLRKKNAKDLMKDIESWREKVATMNRERLTSELKNVHEIRGLRKDIARALTVVSELNREGKA